MELKVGIFYKLCEEVDIGEEKVFEYYICLGEQEEFYVLQELDTYIELNKMWDEMDMIDDIDDYFKDIDELKIKHFKKVNPMECLYYKTKVVEVKKEKSNRRFSLS